MDTLLDRLNALEKLKYYKGNFDIIRAPFGYPGSKLKSANYILPVLPYRNGYIEVFGGTGTILLNRKPSRIEVFNDRYSGITAFYLCMQNKETFQRLLSKLDNTVHSREFWNWCITTWASQEDIVDRAFRWFYTTQYSFGQLGRNFARTLKDNNRDSGKIRRKLQGFQRIHDRLELVCIENLDWRKCLQDYDNIDHVFYLDPPYLNVHKGTYIHEMTELEHKEMCQIIFRMKGFVALSGYDNDLYNSFPWDYKKDWCVTTMIGAEADERRSTNECLWIKEARA